MLLSYCHVYSFVAVFVILLKNIQSHRSYLTYFVSYFTTYYFTTYYFTSWFYLREFVVFYCFWSLLLYFIWLVRNDEIKMFNPSYCISQIVWHGGTNIKNGWLMAWSLKDMFTRLYAYMLVNWVIAGTDTGILPDGTKHYLNWCGSIMDEVAWHSYSDGLVQDCSNPIANALELLQSCTKPSIWSIQQEILEVSVT